MYNSLYFTREEVRLRDEAIKAELRTAKLRATARRLCRNVGHSVTEQALESRTDNQLRQLIDAALTLLEERSA